MPSDAQMLDDELRYRNDDLEEQYPEHPATSFLRSLGTGPSVLCRRLLSVSDTILPLGRRRASRS